MILLKETEAQSASRLNESSLNAPVWLALACGWMDLEMAPSFGDAAQLGAPVRICTASR